MSLMTSSSLRRGWRLFALPLLLAGGACRQDGPTLARAPAPAAPLAALTCTADARARTLSCANGVTGARKDMVTLGGQNHFVRLASSGTAYDGVTDVLSSSVTVQNLLAAAIGTPDGALPDADGVRVFFATGPTKGVTVGNASGVAAFTAAGQPYFQYSGGELGSDGMLAAGETSVARTWQFQMNGAASFTFVVYVQAQTASQPAAFLHFTAVTANNSHTCALTAAGAAYCWGWNDEGQLGTGDTTHRITPTAVLGGLTFTALTAGSKHACGLTSAGQAYCWGWNLWSQLGAGGDGTSAPVAVPQPAGVTFASITAGGEHTCGLTAAGEAYCWGSTYPGEQHASEQVSLPAGVTFASLAAGERMTCGLTPAGQAYCWGFNFFGELGDSTTTDRQTPAPVAQPAGVTFTSLAASFVHVCGLTAGGQAYCWGEGILGQLGNGDTDQQNAPVAVSQPAGVTFVSIATGWQQTCGLTASGQAYCWGGNNRGQLGTGGGTTDTPVAVAQPGVAFTALAAGNEHTCALTAGPLFCWGRNVEGELGDGATTNRFTPVPVAGTQ